MLVVYSALLLSFFVNIYLYVLYKTARENGFKWWEKYCNIKEKHDKYKTNLYTNHYNGDFS